MSMRTRIHKFLLCLVISFSYLASLEVKAQETGGSSSGKLFTFSLAAKGGLGTTESADGTTLKKTDQYVYGAELNLGFRISSFILGAAASYVIWGQRTPVGDVDDKNSSGTQNNISLLLGYGTGKFGIFLKPYLSSTFSLKTKNSAGDTGQYLSPEVFSYDLQFLYTLASGNYVGVELSNAKYTKYEDGTNSVNLESGTEMEFNATNIIYGWVF
jgi:hypothetical protein